MKTMIFVLVTIGIIFGFASIAMAGDWYSSSERSSNDYRSSVGTMISEVNGAKYTPRYTAAEMQNTQVAADTRQIAQANAVQSSPASQGVTQMALSGSIIQTTGANDPVIPPVVSTPDPTPVSSPDPTPPGGGPDAGLGGGAAN